MVEAKLDPLQLSLLLPDGQRLSSPLAQLALRNAGFDGAQLEISWTQDGARYALLIDDSALIEKLRAQAPPALQPALTAVFAQRRRARLHRGLGLSAVAIWIGLPLIALLLLFLAARPLAGWIAGFVPLKQEQQLGEMVFRSQAAQLKMIEGTAANAALEQIGARLTQGSRYTYRWHIARNAQLNAFAIPGGHIVVYSGLIEAADDATELAGVLAHEVEHVELRHSLKAMMQQAGLRLAIAAVIGDFGIASEAAGRLSGLQFSRDSEREADTQGLQRLIASGIDPQGMLRLFAKLDTQTQGVAPPAWLNSHPATPQRITGLRQAIERSGARPAQPLSIAWTAVKQSLGE
ncbi:M48 family metallopeptidase [Hydrocarboniphaga sp.]|uniref:M48 family metallopeptidase n=1 Tax=Hydrocarboniphaga sp. TaxID=2033016 RepID=UPI003D148501